MNSGTLAEKLHPFAARLESGRFDSARFDVGRVVSAPVLQIDLALANAPDDAAAAAIAILRDWLARRIGGDLPEAATHRGFDLRPAHDLEVLAGEAPWIWAAHFVEPDSTMPDRAWGTEVALYRPDGGAGADAGTRLAVRRTCSGRGNLGAFAPAVPGFVRAIAEQIGLLADRRVLDSAATAIHDGLAVDALVNLLLDHSRRLPAIVASTTIRDERLIDADALARQTIGLAHVFVIDFEAARALTRRLDKPWSVFEGAVRLYQPGCDPTAQSPREHLLVLARDLADPAARREALGRLAARVARTSVERSDAGRRLPAFRELRAQLEQVELDRRLSTVVDETDRAALLETKIRTLEHEREEAIELAAEQERMRLEARQDLDEIRLQNFALRARIEQLERRPASGGFGEKVQRPASYAALTDWAEGSFPDRLVFSAKGRQAVAKAPFADLDLVCDALELLAYDYVDMRRQGGGRQAFEAGLQRLRLRDEPIVASPERHRSDPQYWCRHEGRDLFTERHLKKGTSRDPREILRIYYAWDEESRQVVIGHLTTHLETAIS